ncbi:MAG: methylenetetrahydrofolate reductase [NAD(P)H] [Deltaproteobacteria bacterium]|nr:methylenetetrahydrofolate reductase [NAD(P)H] [Deltaproteobacteria bacterium]MBW2383679.1 methylenetetrahydrofolate reductase [NAD(P)H] [Deltaproteobacteria bacterium]
MSIVELYGRGDPVISFEFFPPKTDAGFRSLFSSIEDLKQLAPGFVSVTMGAGGSTRAKTVDLVIRIQQEIGITAMAHLPCTGFGRAQISEILDHLETGGVRNVLSLRGDPPQDTEDFRPPKDGFAYANELTEFIAARGGFCIGGACYPEVHPEAPSAEVDLENLVRKVRAGAEFLVSQLFFDNQKFFAFVDRAHAAGIDVPIVAGIMPITSVKSIRRMISLGGGSIPAELDRELARVDEDDAGTLEIGVQWATEQCRELLDRGVPGIHFYTLNRSPATRRIHEALF